MVKFKWLVVLVLFLIAVQPSFADDRAKILGIWRIVSYELELQATGEREPVLGKNPTGYTIFTPEGRMMVIITGEGRKAPNRYIFSGSMATGSNSSQRGCNIPEGWGG